VFALVARSALLVGVGVAAPLVLERPAYDCIDRCAGYEDDNEVIEGWWAGTECSAAGVEVGVEASQEEEIFIVSACSRAQAGRSLLF
jgi:hypothetical protein